MLTEGRKDKGRPYSTMNSPSSKYQEKLDETCERTLDAPDIVDDYYHNLVDWCSGNIFATSLGSIVHLWDESKGKAGELCTIDDENGPITRISWAPNGGSIAVCLDNSDVQLWDTGATKLLFEMPKRWPPITGEFACLEGPRPHNRWV